MLYVDDPRAQLQKLLEERAPTYSEADIVIVATDAPADVAAADAEQHLIEAGVVLPPENDA